MSPGVIYLFIHTHISRMPCANCACQNTSGGCDKVSSIPLPKAGTTPSAQAKLWSTSNYGSTSTASNAAHENTPLLDGAQQPLAKCEKHNGIRGVCCRDLKQDNQRHLVNPDVVRDVIIGLSDGLTVPFALTAGLSGVGSTRIVVLAGFAELVSGAISMGVGGLLSAQAELSHYNYMCQATAERVHQSCAGELEREVCDILAPFGVPNDIGSQIASKLQNVERQEQAYEGTSHSLPSPATADRSAHIRPDGLVGPSRGLTPFLVRIGEGLEKVEASRVWQSALIIGTSYFVGGL